MTSPAAKKEASEAIKRFSITWAAMFAGIGIYAAITFFVLTRLGPVVELEPGAMTILKAVLGAVAAANAALVVFLGRMMLGRDAVQRALTRSAGQAKERGAAFAEAEKATAVRGYYFQTLVIRWAVAETAAVIGIVLAIISQEAATPSLFYLVSAALMAMTRPKAEELDEMTRMAASIPLE